MNQVLFVCTRNICSSRVAEILFNHQVTERSFTGPAGGRRTSIKDPKTGQPIDGLSNKRLPDWKADSRGFEVSANLDSPISRNAADYLSAQNLCSDQLRSPRQIESSDLLWSDLIIALNEEEHRPIVESRYLMWANRVEYWNVPDFHESNWGRALTRLEANIHELVNLIRVREKLGLYSQT